MKKEKKRGNQKEVMLKFSNVKGRSDWPVTGQ